MNKALGICSISAALLLLPQAWAMRCNQALVDEGATKYEVTQKCGEPKAKEVLTESQVIYDPLGVPIGEVPYSYEIWIYQRSPSDFLYEISFEDGKVKSIHTKRSGF